MDTTLIDSLKNILLSSFHWEQEPVVLHDGTSVDLCLAIGQNSSCPPNAPNQPEMFPKKSHYQFDNKIYKGIGAGDAIEKLVKSFCPGCRLYRQRKNSTTVGGVTFTFCCNHYKTLDSQFEDNFAVGKFSKVGVVKENVKGRSGTKKEDGNTSFSRMVNSKMKSKQKNQRSRKTLDQRGKNSVYKNKKPTIPVTKRTVGVRPADVEERCLMNIKVFYCNFDECWYLLSSSHLEHRFHPEEDVDTNLLNEADLSENQFNYMRVMYDKGVSPQTIANIMSEVLNKSGKSGEFLAKTIRNINEKCQAAMDVIAGISSDMSIAEKTMAKLNE